MHFTYFWQKKYFAQNPLKNNTVMNQSSCYVNVMLSIFYFILTNHYSILSK